MVMKFLLKKQLRTQNSKIHSIKKVRKSTKWCLFLTPNFRTRESIRNTTKKTAKMRFYLFWQSQRESNPCYRNENPMS